MRYFIERFNFKQFKILAYAYAEHLVKEKHEGWKNQWRQIYEQRFCKRHQCACASVFNHKTHNHEYYCRACEAIVEDANILQIPDYLMKLKEKS